MIAKGLITKRANEEQMPTQTIERDYVLTHACADLGALNDPRLVFKGGTLLRLCYFESYRYSADLDFSAIGGLSRTEALAIVAEAVTACRRSASTSGSGPENRAPRRYFAASCPHATAPQHLLTLWTALTEWTHSSSMVKVTGRSAASLQDGTS